MKRTKEWWNCLTKEERSRLVFLERAEKQSGWYSESGCFIGTGLCPSCLKEMLNLINKADKKCLAMHMMHEIKEG